MASRFGCDAPASRVYGFGQERFGSVGSLEPYESAFVVFREPAQASDASRGGVNYPEPVPVVEITAPWTVAFDAARRGPGESVTMDSLTDWALSDDDRIRFYSGTASYKNRFTWQAADPSRRLLLDLGCVAAMARVRLNGRDVGGCGLIRTGWT